MLRQIKTVTALSLIALVCINTVGCGANSINTSSDNEAFINNSNEDIYKFFEGNLISVEYTTADESKISYSNKENLSLIQDALKSCTYEKMDESDYVEGFYSIDLVFEDRTESIGIDVATIALGGNQYRIIDGDLSNVVSKLNIDSIKDISEYFIDPHEHESMKDGYTEKYDLNGDGKEETITIEQLPCNGGDGAYYPHVYDSEGVEIAYQDDIEDSPFKEKWDNGNVEFYYNDEKFYSLDKAEVKSIYLESATEEEIDKNLSGNQERGIDLASGFVVSETDGKPELIVKYYTEGVMPHVVSLGYCLLHLKLNNDEKWEITPEFVRDSKSNTDAQVIIPALDYYWAICCLMQ